MRRRNALVVVGSAVVLALALGVFLKLGQAPSGFDTRVGSLVLVLTGHAAAANDVDQPTALATALRNIRGHDAENGSAPVAGYTVKVAYHALGLTKARTRSGSEILSLGTATDAWVFEFDAPPQQGWKVVKAIAIVDAKTGKLVAYSEDKHN